MIRIAIVEDLSLIHIFQFMALRLTGLNAKYMNQEMHMKKYDVTALGELLIDFTENRCV